MIILMGVAGAGKSMQGKILADEHGYAWISTGEILRVLVTGKRRHEMLQGKLLSDEEMIRLMDKVLDLIDTKQEFVLDGFPRTVPQADWLLKQVKEGRFKLTAVIHLAASEAVVRSRLLSRARPDDTEEAIKERFSEYSAVTVPIIAHLEKMGARICNIEASEGIRAVHDAILKCVD
jgi:adenylate kinase